MQMLTNYSAVVEEDQAIGKLASMYSTETEQEQSTKPLGIFGSGCGKSNRG